MLSVFLIGRTTVTEDFIISNSILPLSASIARIALYGIDNSVFHSFYNTDMVGFAVLSVFIVPIVENDLTC